MKINKSHIVLFFVLILISASVSAGFFDFLTGWVANNKSKNYDIVIVGAGSGGIATAIQAARMGTKVALLEETNDIGGQMITVSAMDEGSLKKEREGGLYSEFVNNIINYYSNIGKSVGTCGWSSSTICFEPHIGKQILVNMIKKESNIDIYLHTKVQKAIVSKNVVKGIITTNGMTFNSKIVVDATEYGDIIPLTPARYRIGNSLSGVNDENSCIQDITYTAIVKKYLNGAPSELVMKNAPPNYAEYRPMFEQIINNSGSNWYVAWGKYPVDWITHNAYRGVPDSSNPNNYVADAENAQKITKTGINWANDYPSTDTLKIKYLDDKEYRTYINCEAKLKTLNFIYYLQQELGLDWSISNEDGFNINYNIAENSCKNIPAEFKEIEKYFPPYPYIRESRRIIPVYTLTAGDIKRIGNPPRAFKTFNNSISVGYYHNDLHNCKNDNNLESSLESRSDVPSNWTTGPFQIPFESFIPEKVDGFLAAEKNIGVTRLVNGATRLQPITMSTGQAVGVIAALSVIQNKKSRDISPLAVQNELLNEGLQISIYSYDDVPRSNPNWKHVQLVSTYGFMIGVGEGKFDINRLLTRAEFATVLANILNLPRNNPPETPTFIDVSKTEWYYKHIEAIYKAGITAGCSTNPPKYCPNNFVTREEMATFIVKILNESPYPGTYESFSDVPKTKWSHKWVEKINQLGIMSGYSDGTFKPEKQMTRGEVAEVLYNYLCRNGACLPKTNQPKVCTDSDDGINYYEKGTLNYNNLETYDDFCNEKGNLNELYCVFNNTSYSSTEFTCPYGCKNGACRPDSSKCSTAYSPMCGQLNNQLPVTYGNLCLLNEANAKLLYEGICKINDKQECSGCLLENTCLPFGIRINSQYCDISRELKIQLVDGDSCQNDFECQSNSCMSGQCGDIKKELAETKGMLQKLLDWMKSIFG